MGRILERKRMVMGSVHVAEEPGEMESREQRSLGQILVTLRGKETDKEARGEIGLAFLNAVGLCFSLSTSACP